MWREALQRGEIPGAYWAVLTPPGDQRRAECVKSSPKCTCCRTLMGAANRADIRRLRQLEAENAELQAKGQRQQSQLRDSIVARDTTIRELSQCSKASVGQSITSIGGPAHGQVGRHSPPTSKAA